MIVYALMTILSVGFAILATNDMFTFNNDLIIYSSNKAYHVRVKNILIVLSFIPLLIVSGLRYQVGTDYQSYINIFNQILNTGSTTRTEVGYIILNKLVQIFSENPQSIIIITSLISYSLVYKTVYDLSPSVAFSLYTFITAALLFPSYNLIRQFIAVAISLYAFRFIYRDNKKIVMYILFIILAASFHKTALIMIPIGIASLIRFRLKHYIMMVLVLVVMFIFRDDVLEFIVSIVYPGYIGSRYLARVIINQLQIAHSILSVIFIIVYRKTLFKSGKSSIVLINFTVFRAMMAILMAWVPMLWRMLIYLDIIAIVTIPIIIGCEGNYKTRRLYYAMFIVLSSIYVVYSIWFRYSHNVIPYQSSIFVN